MHTKILRVIACCGLIATAVCGCGNKGQELRVPDKATYVHEIPTYEVVTKGEFQPQMILDLRMEGYESIGYSMTIRDLRIENVNVSLGSRVKAGDILMTFSADSLNEKKMQYESAVEERNRKIEHLKRQMEFAPSDELGREIRMLTEDNEIAFLYLQEIEEELKQYRITAEHDGVIVMVHSAILAGNYTPGVTLFRETCISGRIEAVINDEMSFQTGETFTAYNGIIPMELKVDEIGTVEGEKVVFFVPVSESTMLSGEEKLKLTLAQEMMSDAITVPKTAIHECESGTYVLVLAEDGYADARFVTCGAADDSRIVITEGIAEGEKVVVQ